VYLIRVRTAIELDLRGFEVFANHVGWLGEFCVFLQTLSASRNTTRKAIEGKVGIEIERKFLVVGEAWRSLASGSLYIQGYLTSSAERTVRVRLVGDQGFLTIKGASQGYSRAEYEYNIPAADALEMLRQLCQQPLIEKMRYKIPVQGLVWEVDEFAGENQGLIMAEVELQSPDQEVVLPSWIGKEVTGDPRYYNASLAKFPFKDWGSNA
jgi:adenylate cyclase